MDPEKLPKLYPKGSPGGFPKGSVLSFVGSRSQQRRLLVPAQATTPKRHGFGVPGDLENEAPASTGHDFHFLRRHRKWSQKVIQKACPRDAFSFQRLSKWFTKLRETTLANELNSCFRILSKMHQNKIIIVWNHLIKYSLKTIISKKEKII